MAQVNLAGGKCSVLVITDSGDDEEEEMFPASRTNCPVCPGLMHFLGGRNSVPKLERARQTGMDGPSLPALCSE